MGEIRGPQPEYQDIRVGLKGDPTPDHEYGDDPEDVIYDAQEEKDDPRKTLKCKECGNQRKMTREKFHAYEKHTCSRMTFEPEVGEVPCGGEMEVIE